MANRYPGGAGAEPGRAAVGCPPRYRGRMPVEPGDERVPQPGGDPQEPFVERLRDAAIAAELATGKREETVGAAERHVLRRLARMALGSLLVVVGVVMLVLPGPGWL